MEKELETYAVDMLGVGAMGVCVPEKLESYMARRRGWPQRKVKKKRGLSSNARWEESPKKCVLVEGELDLL